AKTGAAILPVSIDGAVYTAFTRMKPPFPRKTLPRIRLRVFPLEYLPMPEARTGRIRRQMASREMRRRMERMRFRSRKRRTLHEAFLDAVALHGRDTVMLDDVRRREQTYQFLLKASLALGRLAGKLAGEGEIVGILLPNTGVTAALLLGMFGTRRIPAMLNYAAGLDGLQTACTAAKVRTVITSREFLSKARLTEKVGQLTSVELVYMEDLRSRFGLLDKLWLVCWALRWPGRAVRRTRPEDPAVVLFTSGSEGKPKGVVLSHDSILANVEQIRAVIEFSNRDRFMTALPMFHSFGLTAGVLLPLLSGCRLFLYPSPLHFRMIPELTYDQDCTVLFGTPSFLAKYGAVANPYDFYNVRYVVAGAEKLSEEVRQLYHEKFGIRILEGYGATECSPVLAVNTPFAHKSGTVGTLLPSIDHRVLPVAGIPNGGELH
ncbi:MAG: AMP-binding protein, partial [bacterium]|nr:AMP-binding protein [bacterium]